MVAGMPTPQRSLTRTATTTEPPDPPGPPDPPRGRTRRRSVLLAAAVAGVALTGCTPTGVWGPLESSYNGSVRVEGSGFYYPDRSTYAASGMIVRDRANDGNTVYGRTRFSFWQYDGSCSCSRFVTTNVKSTGEWANETRGETLYESLSWIGTRSRGQMYVCAQMGWPVPDSCSNSAYVTFDY